MFKQKRTSRSGQSKNTRQQRVYRHRRFEMENCFIKFVSDSDPTKTKRYVNIMMTVYWQKRMHLHVEAEGSNPIIRSQKHIMSLQYPVQVFEILPSILWVYPGLTTLSGRPIYCGLTGIPLLVSVNLFSRNFSWYLSWYFIRFEVITAVVMKPSIFYDITPCNG
jgi:hypothetical protein